MERVKKSAGQYHHGHLKDALVQAAEQYIVRTGQIDLPLREVAKRAGVSHAAAYRHFSSKSALLAELAMRGFWYLTTQLKPTDGLEAAALAYVRLASLRPATFRVMFHSALKPFTQHPELEAAANEALAELHRVVRLEIARGTLRDDAAQSAVSTAWALLHGLATLLIEGQLSGPFRGSFDDLDEAVKRAMGHLLRTPALEVQSRD